MAETGKNFTAKELNLEMFNTLVEVREFFRGNTPYNYENFCKMCEHVEQAIKNGSEKGINDSGKVQPLSRQG